MTAPHRKPLGAPSRLRKLRAMSSGELWSRVRYSAYCRLERARHARGALADTDRLRLALVRPLARSADWRRALVGARQQSAVHFFPGVEQRDVTRALFLERFCAEHQRLRDEAGRVLRRELSFFGGTYRYDGRIDWHADPVSGAPWPKVYHRDVPVHGGDVGFGDVKHVWELGRHQFLIDLAKAWAIDRDARASAAIRDLVFDWRDENPLAPASAGRVRWSRRSACCRGCGASS